MNAGFTFDAPPIALTVAGSDSGGGAGIQADLKTFAALGCYGASVITAVTSQNTVSVSDVHELPPTNIATQFDAVVSDLRPHVVKTGMLSSVEIVNLVADKISEHAISPLVVDPVMVSETGARLISPDAVRVVVKQLVPRADVITPNAHEAEVLTDVKITQLDDLHTAAKALRDLGARCVVVKGGHVEGDLATDVLLDDDGFEEFSAKRINTVNTHGTGCTFASAIAAGLAFKLEIRESIALAKRYVTDSIAFSFPVGRGKGPLSHFSSWWRSSDGPYRK